MDLVERHRLRPFVSAQQPEGGRGHVAPGVRFPPYATPVTQGAGERLLGQVGPIGGPGQAQGGYQSWVAGAVELGEVIGAVLGDAEVGLRVAMLPGRLSGSPVSGCLEGDQGL